MENQAKEGDYTMENQAKEGDYTTGKQVKNQHMDDEWLASKLAELASYPLEYVMFMFPWDTCSTIQLVELQSPYKERFPDYKYGPDAWACKFLDDLGEQIRKRAFDGHTPVSPVSMALVSGHGTGKTTLAAWLIKFILDTRPYSKGIVTASTEAQLRTKTWAELGKWHSMSLTSHWFDYNSDGGMMNLSSTKCRENWRCDAWPCGRENFESFAGQQVVNSSSFYIFDEASCIPDKIFEIREGGLTDGEPFVFDFGNGTRNSGAFFRECKEKNKHFIVYSLDSRDATITYKKRIQEWVKDYGEDSDFVKVRVKGEFPVEKPN